MREIKGPEDVQALLDGEWKKLFGDAIALAMDAQRNLMSSVGQRMSNEQRAEFLNNCKAWRELSERLKGM